VNARDGRSFGGVTVTQRIFAVMTPRAGVCADDLAGAMQIEAAHAWSWHERGTLRELWTRTDAPGAVYVLESTPAAAVDVLARQPMVRAGLIGYDLAPVSAFLCLVDLFGRQQRAVEPASTEPRRGTRRVLALDRLGDGVTREHLDAYMVDEARQTWALLKAGLVREAYRRTDRPGAVLLLEAAGLDDAASIVGDLPLVRAHLVTYDLMAVGAFTGLDALMDGAL
jgi:hypothetical protein